MEFISSVIEERSVNTTDRTVTGLITTNAIDRYGEVVEAKGMNDSAYEKNPVVLLGHNHATLPVGKNLWRKTQSKGVLAKTQFVDNDIGNELVKFYDEGFLNAFSIGFIPTKWIDGNQKDEKWIRKFTEWELLEYSAVSIPANPEALAKALKVCSAPELRTELEKHVEIDAAESYNERLDEILKEIKAQTETIRNQDALIADIQTQLKTHYISQIPDTNVEQLATKSRPSTEEIRKEVVEIVANISGIDPLKLRKQ